MAKILFTSYYKDKSEVRQKELEYCIQKNIENKFIDKIIVLVEGQKEQFPILNHVKITALEKPRPTYKIFFDVVNSMVSEDDFSIISNTDIYFDDSINMLDNNLSKQRCFALSRYHYHSDSRIELHNEKWSQDVWCFKGKIRNIKFCNFHLGERGCDNRIAYELKLAGYQIFNPAHSIRCIHYHLSDLHNYGNNFIPKPYMPVPLCKF